MEITSKKQIWLEWLLILVTIFFTIFVVFGGALFIFEKKYQDRIYPGVQLGQINLSGLTSEQAKNILTQKIDELQQSGINFFYDNSYTTILPTVTSAESDLIYFLMIFDIDKTVASAYAVGRSNHFIVDLVEKIKTLLYGRNIKTATQFEDEKINKILESSFADRINPTEDAKLIYSQGDFNIANEKLGQEINYEQGISQLKKQMGILDFSPITLTASVAAPKITRLDCERLLSEAEKMLALTPLILMYEDVSWPITKDLLGEWITVKLASGGDKELQTILGLEEDKVTTYFNEGIVPLINEGPKEAKFSMEDSRVVEFQASRDGIELNTQASIKMIENTLKQGSSTIQLITRKLKSKTKTQEVNNLGIKEIIGTGWSNFSGSPTNRRHNIRNGANTLHGQLIKPDEEFSLVTALGEIEASTGYLPELVIKGNQTIPEYGGGLCQIGTTMFRVALGTGLPITMRRNHSYRVSYYEPAGTDATIYNPWPDLRFVNDTGHHILIQSRIEGDDLYFDFWGTSDGRIASRTDPVIYNITKPGPTKYVETLDLPVGEKKCTERAHNGADTYFDYIVSFPEGEVREERYKSHYVPWREVCLIGVEKLSTETKEDNATTTEEIIEE